MYEWYNLLMILVVSYTCAITFLLTYNGLLQIHPTHKIWYQIWGQSGCLNVLQKLSQGAPSLSLGALKVFQDAPTLWRHILLLQHLALWMYQVTPGGVSRCIHMCRKNILFQKIKYMFGGLIFSVSRCPSFAYPYICKNWCARHATPCHDTW